MISLRAYRHNPHFADLFAHVHPLCWPILWWQLNTLFAWCRREGIPAVLCSVNSRGFLTLRHAGARPDPAVYQPLPRTFRPLTDDSRGSDLPIFATGLAAPEALRRFPILPREAGEVAPKGSEGALPSMLDSTWPFLSSRLPPR